MDVRVGDILLMKKKHPCGGEEFTVTRSGMDFKLVCRTCGREIMIPRAKAERHIKNYPSGRAVASLTPFSLQIVKCKEFLPCSKDFWRHTAATRNFPRSFLSPMLRRISAATGH